MTAHSFHSTDTKQDTAELDTEGRLLLAAREVFAQKGLHGASTKEITDAAGIQKSTLHYYFRRKEDLYATVFERAFAEMIEPLAQAFEESSSFKEILRAFVAHHVRAYADNPVNVRLWMHENLIGAPVSGPLLRRYDQFPNSPYRRFVESLSEAIEAGEIRSVDPIQTFVTVMGACLFFHVAQPSMVTTLPSKVGRPDEELDVEAFLDAREDAVFDLLYNGLVA
ncbi:MAG: TetR/AcrR family transcriptional regulator [Acidobacteriota bacterium]